MFNNYPTPEQLYFFREQLWSKSMLSEEEKEVLNQLNLLMRQADTKMGLMQAIIDENFPEDLQQKLKEEGHPFTREGEIYMGSGYFAEYGCEKLHEELAKALSLVSGLQQGGLQGSEPDDQEKILKAKEELQGFLLKLAEKLGVTGMSFENSSK